MSGLRIVKFSEMTLIKLGLRNDKLYFKTEADTIIAHQKYKRCSAMANMCGQAVSRYLANGRLYEIEVTTAEGERRDELLEQAKDCDRLVTFYDRWYHRWSKITETFKEKDNADTDKSQCG